MNFRKFFCLVLAGFLIPALAAAASSAGDAVGRVLAYCLAQSGASDTQEWMNGALTEDAGGLGTQYAPVLIQSVPGLDSSSWINALEHADQASLSPASRLKIALCLVQYGKADSPCVEKILQETAGESGVMCCIYRLRLLAAMGRDTSDALEALLALQLEDGGWAVSGQVSDVDVTAMALQPLSQVPGTDEAVSRALALLSDRQLESGGFSSYGAENCESTAQVILALEALKLDPETDERFQKGGNPISALLAYQLPSGAFCHVSGGNANALATAQAYSALVALGGEAGSAVQLPLRTWIYLGIVAGAVLATLFLFLTGKRSWKRYGVVLVIAALLCGLNSLLTFHTPAEYYGHTAVQKETVGTVTIEIRCDTVADGSKSVILSPCSVAISEGETVLDVLKAAARENGIVLEVRNGYVAGIATLHEFDYGDQSGWMYRVNGVVPSLYSGEYVLSPDDRVEWLYTKQLGGDL